MGGTRIGFVAGSLITAAVVGLAAAIPGRSGTTAEAGSPAQVAGPSLWLGLDLQEDGPFGGGKRVDLSEAASISGFSLPPPPETEATGRLTAIWVSESERQVAYVWESDLCLYISRTQSDPAAIAARWKEKAEEPGSRWELVPLSFAEGIGARSNDTNPSSLVYHRDGYEFMWVGPKQSLAQLVELAEALKAG